MVLTDSSPKNQIYEQLSRAFWNSVDWLYPPSCCNCGRPGQVLCADCLSQIEVLKANLCVLCGYPVGRRRAVCENCSKLRPAWDQMRSWAVYNDPLKNAIQDLKYHKNLAIGAVLAESLAAIVRNSGWKVDMVLPVPLSDGRMRERGYNQSAWLARPLARKLNLPFSNTNLKRVKYTEKQTSLDVNKRFTNLMDAFYANPAKLMKRHVLLIDDVITTGATMHHCTIALRKAGAESVYCLSAARALLRKQISDV